MVEAALDDPAAPAVPATPAGSRRAWGAVALLTLVGTVNLADRFLPSVLAEPIKHELLLSDTALGLINGFGFLLVYAVLGIPIARLSDRGAYGRVISACLALWSVMTMLGGLAQTGLLLGLTRMGVALGEAGSAPAAHAYISRNFRPERRAAPLSVLTLSVPFASTVGLMGAGLLGQALGWRATFIAMGAVSLLLAPLVLVVLGGRPPAASDMKAPSASRGATLSLLKKRSFLTILAGSAFVAIAGYTLTAFVPAFLMRSHGLAVGQVGVQYGIVSGIEGIAGLLITGYAADRLSARDPRWLLWVLAAMIGLLIPFGVIGLLSPNRWVAIGGVGLANMVGTAYMVPVVVAIQRLAPVDLRATASAILLFFSALFGGLGPFLVGVISDALQAELGPAALGRALLLAPVAQVLAALLYLAAASSFRRDMVPDDGRQP